MKHPKLLWILLLVFLGLSFSKILASQKETASTNKKVTEVKVEDGEIYIKTSKGDEVKLSQDEFKHLQAISESASETTQQEQEPELPENEPGKYRTFTDKIVKTGSDIVVQEDQVVREDVVAIGGNITVKGKVEGDVVAIGGTIRITPGGIIQGDAVSVGGGIEKELGGVIQGDAVDARLPFMGRGIFSRSPSSPHQPFHPVFAISGLLFFARIIKIGIFLLLAIAVFAIAAKNVEKIKNKIDHDFWISLLVGLAVLLLIAPVFVTLLSLLCIVLLITIIGILVIPIAILLAVVAVVAYFLLAYTSGAYFLGNRIKENTSLKPETPMMTLLVGVLSVEAVLLFAQLIGIFGGPLVVLEVIITVLGWVIFGIIVTVGLGAGLLTRFGTRPKDVKIDQKPKTAGENPPNPSN